jgi:AcrR family transcriptional regulator
LQPPGWARREVRRQELVEAAIAVFSAKGVAAASVDDIVRAAFAGREVAATQ